MKAGYLTLTALALSVAAAATTAEAGKKSDKAAERLSQFERTGEFKNCIGLRSINQITALDEHHLLVRVGVNDYYLNKPSGKCNGAGRAFNRLQYTTSLSQLCSNEIIRIVDNSSGFTVGSCGLRKFERLEPKAPDTGDEAAG